MSYHRRFEPDTDTLSQLVSTITDCLAACRQMMEYKNDQIGFLRWYDKAKTIDGRTTYLFLKEHADEISPDCLKFCRGLIEKGDQKRQDTIEKVKSDCEKAGRAVPTYEQG